MTFKIFQEFQIVFIIFSGPTPSQAPPIPSEGPWGRGSSGELWGTPGDPPGLPPGSSGRPFSGPPLDIHGCLWDALGPPMHEFPRPGFWDHFFMHFSWFSEILKNSWFLTLAPIWLHRTRPDEAAEAQASNLRKVSLVSHMTQPRTQPQVEGD